MTPQELISATLARRAAERRALEDLPLVRELRARIATLEAALQEATAGRSTMASAARCSGHSPVLRKPKTKPNQTEDAAHV